jgi:hypothetical protein
MTPQAERNFYAERLGARISELRRLHKDDETFRIEATKVLVATARTESERKEWQRSLRMFEVLAN